MTIENNRTRSIQKSINDPKANFHPSIQPYNISEVNTIISIDSIDFSTNTFSKFYPNKASEKTLTISAYPLLSASGGWGKDSTNNIIYDSRIGAMLSATIASKLNIVGYYQGGIGKYAHYIEEYSNLYKVIPGFGYAHQSTSSIHYRNWGGHLSYSPSSIFNFTLGHGKNFFGNGYRSLLLSDAANNYSYFRITTSVGKFKYVQLYSAFRDISSTNYTDYFSMPLKYGAFHYLSWNIAPWLNASFFETVIWPNYDNDLHRGFDLSYLNPVTFYRPVEYSIGSSDNSLIGLNLQLKLSAKHQLYGQLMLDEFLLSQVRSTVVHHWLGRDDIDTWGWWANKQALQAGYRWFDAFFIKNLNWRIEYNFVPPYTYSHTGGLLNYGHENQPLAHSSGANLHELINILDFQRNNWYCEFKTMYQVIGKDSGSVNYGSNIFLDYGTHFQTYNNYAGQGVTSKILFNQLKFGYILLPQTNLSVEFGYLNRQERNAADSYSANYFFGGIKTSIGNRYRDL